MSDYLKLCCGSGDPEVAFALMNRLQDKVLIGADELHDDNSPPEL